MGETRRVVIPYSPRSQFLPFHNREERFAWVVAHRRAGKTVACVNDLIRGALTCDRPNPRFAYLAPFYKQAKDVAWQYLVEFASAVPGVELREYELRADFPNGGRVRLYGADNPDALRGVYLDGVVLDEAADMSGRLWPEVIRPALSDRKGWAAFIGTPKGKNEFWRVGEDARDDPAWFRLVLKASETGLIDPDELESARKAMSPDQFAQEYECSFEAAIQGAYYGDLMKAAEDEGRITNVPHEPKVKVTTAWDLGIGDSTAIWFCQQVGHEVRLIDYYEASGVGFDHYAKVLAEKPYVYADHLLPHDAAVKELGTGRSRVETLAGLGIKARIVPQIGVDDGINAVRLLLPRVWFDRDKCRAALEALRQYRKEWDDRMKVFRARPRHDWTSHCADALRYLAVGLRPDDRGWKTLTYPSRKVA